ncbi:MAG: hypothetical protein KatS3mg087_1447 [Patescibacteria group bacterium]|nr:MAG: hypothetical protein KatS3mg087_1447 [Patescibacteria group bacterium]
MSKIVSILHALRSLPKNFINFFRLTFFHTLSFIFLLVIYLLTSIITNILLHKFVPIPYFLKNNLVININNLYQRIVKMNHLNEDSINRTNLIQLALYNMNFKKSRTFITVGGMAIGIAAIVYLVSIGYGLQELVVSRVARLDEMRQANISSPIGGQARLNDQTLSQMQEISDIDKVLPQIAAVGRVTYNNSVSDVVIYGVTSDYLTSSAIQPSSGKIFENNALTVSAPAPQVAGLATSINSDNAAYLSAIGPVEFSLNQGEWLRVRDQPSTKGKVIGYTRRIEGVQSGTEVWGDPYAGNTSEVGSSTDDKELHRWISASFLLWEKTTCSPVTQSDCENLQYRPLISEEEQQVRATGYIAELNLQVDRSPVLVVGSNPAVLGIQDESNPSSAAVLNASTPPASETSTPEEIEFVEDATESATQKEEEVEKVSLGTQAVKEVVVNRSALSLLGIAEDQAINQTINLSFIVVGELLDDPNKKIQSLEEPYKIVGVIPDDRSPVMYVPFIDLRTLGVSNYSQVKILTKGITELPKVRTQVEALGFVTQSVADTVAQINNLFSTARTVLFLVGMAALAVASLGMFNTLTVSLLERTREVGLMKAMGMRSSEVHELFLTESMIMGLFGGILGLTLGILAGFATSAILSAYAISQGVGFLSISYTPPVFVMAIMALSLTVGLITGLYPARHATRISALNALRYE